MRHARSFLVVGGLCLLLLPAALTLLSCGSSTPPDSSTTDAGQDAEGGGLPGDAGADAAGGGLQADAGPDAEGGGLPGDAGAPDDASAPGDAGPTAPLPGFGAISGTCGVLDLELTDSSSYIFENHLDFAGDPYDDADLPLLTAGGQKIATDPNAGGSSKLSETFAFEMLDRCELAALLKTEMEIVYQNPSGKLTDELVTIDGVKIGVSVTRAVGYPFDAPYTVAQAKALLDKKLQGILDSTANVSAADMWQKQILYILAYAQEHADAIQAAYAQEPDSLRANTIVMVTVTDGSDAFLY